MSGKKYIFLAILTPFLFKVNNKNACTSFFDYLLINFNGDCYYEPDSYLSTPEVIEKYAGNVQTYTVTTEDGYILTMFRIQRENPIGVILLQPPISGGSMAWLQDRAESLGIILWKKGYEVWFSNHRGSDHSRRHVNLTESDALFWDYSFHEIALYDFDPQFELIHEKTNSSQITFFGYSMSSSAALIYASLKPENSSKFVKSYVLLAPLASLKNARSVFKYLFYIMRPFENFFRMGEFPTLELVRWLGGFVNVIPLMINYAQCLLMGWTIDEYDSALFPYLLANHEKGISNKMLYHYGQIYYNQTHFTMYDYGEETNRKIYGSDLPPPYPLEAIKTPIYIIHAENDYFATKTDIKVLAEKLLPKGIVKGVIQIPNNNHIDLIFSKHRRTKMYESVYKILDSIR